MNLMFYVCICMYCICYDCSSKHESREEGGGSVPRIELG